MKTNQAQTKPQHPMAAAILANIEASTPRKVERVQADSIYAAKMAAKAREAKVIADVKLAGSNRRPLAHLASNRSRARRKSSIRQQGRR